MRYLSAGDDGDATPKAKKTTGKRSAAGDDGGSAKKKAKTTPKGKGAKAKDTEQDAGDDEEGNNIAVGVKQEGQQDDIFT